MPILVDILTFMSTKNVLLISDKEVKKNIASGLYFIAD